MEGQLDVRIYYDNVSKKWIVKYKDNPVQEFGVIVEMLTFLGKKALVLQNDLEYQFKALTEDLQKMFS